MAPRLDRLSPLDLVSLWTDGTDWVQDVGLLAVLDGLHAEGGRGGIEDVRAKRLSLGGGIVTWGRRTR